MKISLFASSVRHKLWEDLFKSVSSNKIDFEIVFAGSLTLMVNNVPGFRYIETGRIKPAQCYEVARRACNGEYIMWIADDCEFSPGLLDNVYAKMQTLHPRTILSIRTNENGVDLNLSDHRLFWRNQNTPQMAPVGLIKRDYAEALGGFDRRFVCGQYENDFVMRAMTQGFQVVRHLDDCVFIEHLKKHGPSTKFWSGYKEDRKILEDTWVVGGYKEPEKPIVTFNQNKIASYLPIENREVSMTPLIPFEPYEDKDLLTVSQSNAGIWR
jgi:hypothetical protein